LTRRLIRNNHFGVPRTVGFVQLHTDACKHFQWLLNGPAPHLTVPYNFIFTCD